MISARSFWISLATLSCLVLAGFSIFKDVYDEVVLLSFLGEDVLSVHDVLLGDLMLDVSHLVLVDAHAVALNHLPGLSLGWEHLGLHGEEVKYVARKVRFLNIEGRHAAEHGEERLLVQFPQLVGSRVAEQHLGSGDRVGIFIGPVDHCGELLGEKLLERPAPPCRL